MSDHPGIGRRYQSATKYRRSTIRSLTLDGRQVPPYKKYANPLATLKLPEPEAAEGMPLWTAVGQRRSIREFSDAPLTLAQVSQLLWAIQGATAQHDGHTFRACASAGALYPNETYLIVNRVQGCEAGVWHYQTRHHSLAQIFAGDMGPDIARACMGQMFCEDAAVVFAWGAMWDRCTWKYGDRGLRYVYLDAGHLGAQLQLACTALGLGSVNVGAFFDDEVNEVLGLSGERESAVYLTAVGVPA